MAQVPSTSPTTVPQTAQEIVVKPTLEAFPGAGDSFYTVPASPIEDEDDEDFEEDYPDYSPRGLLGEINQQDSGTITLQQKQEDTRGRLAVIYTIATFIMFGLGFVVAVLDSLRLNTSIIDELTRILPLLSGIFLGSLGFVLGYYFRKVDSEGKSNY